MKNIITYFRISLLIIPVLVSSPMLAHTGIILSDSISLSGKITYVTGQPMQDVALTLTDGVMSMTVLTDAEGKYVFTGIPAGINYSVGFEVDDDPTTGITVADVILLRQHILGMLDNMLPFNIIAMDANFNGAVTTIDIVNVIQIILDIEVVNPSWRFVSSYLDFPNPQNPLASVFPDASLINSSASKVDIENLDFTAYKIGDVNENVPFNE